MFQPRRRAFSNVGRGRNCFFVGPPSRSEDLIINKKIEEGPLIIISNNSLSFLFIIHRRRTEEEGKKKREENIFYDGVNLCNNDDVCKRVIITTHSTMHGCVYS